MSQFGQRIRPHVSRELQLAREADAGGNPALSFAHLERAHVLGQASTREHVRVHLHMLGWGLRQRSLKEVLGQAFRVFGAATLTVIGLVPTGNTGGAAISPFRPLPLPADLEALIQQASLKE